MDEAYGTYAAADDEYFDDHDYVDDSNYMKLTNLTGNRGTWFG